MASLKSLKKSLQAKQTTNSWLSAVMLVGLASPAWSTVAVPSEKASSDKAPTANPTATKAASTAVSPKPVTEADKLVARAYIDMRAQNWPYAVAALCQALKLERNNAMARRYLCYSLLQSGNAKDTVSQLDALATLNKGMALDMCMRGEALAAMGDNEKASDALREALEQDPNNDYIRGKVIETMQSLGKFQDAAMVCSEGYFAAKGAPQKKHYLVLFNTLQQQRAFMAQRTLGMQLANTNSFPMIRMAPHPKATVGPKKTTDKEAKTTTDDSDDDDATPAVTPVKK
jgi:tetratricopeptide (TPR) repeat protein